jgi:hypothetical protein
MTRTYRVNTSKIKIYPFRHNPLRDFRQAESKYHFLENRNLGYNPRSRHLLSQSNLTSAWDDVYKGVFADKWAGKTTRAAPMIRLDEVDLISEEA